MEMMGWFGSYLLWVGAGGLAQVLLRWPSWLVMLCPFLLVLLLPPLWALGLLSGCWISCAFLTTRPDSNRLPEEGPTFSWFHVVTGSLWVSSGFFLTLLLLWRIKTSSGIGPDQLEILGWSFLILVEVCIYKNIARNCPWPCRNHLALGMTVLTFLMIFYAIAATNFVTKLLTFIILLNGNLFMLVWVDHPPFQPQDPLLRRKR